MGKEAKPGAKLAEIYKERKEPAFREEGAPADLNETPIMTDFGEGDKTVVHKVEVKGPRSYVATDGHCLPIFYKGSIIFIGDKPVEIDMHALKYEARIQFEQALERKQIVETGV